MNCEVFDEFLVSYIYLEFYFSTPVDENELYYYLVLLSNRLVGIGFSCLTCNCMIVCIILSV